MTSNERDELQQMRLLLSKLRHGGSIVSTGAMGEMAIAMARADGDMIVDSDGFGYAWVPGLPQTAWVEPKGR